MNEVKINREDLPVTWSLTNLGSVVNYGRTIKAEPDEISDTDWVLELEDIEKGSSRLLKRMTFLQRQSKSTKNRFKAGDVLYGKLRPYLNKVLIADEPGYSTTEIVPIEVASHIDNSYLFYWLKHPAFLKYVEAESHGMNMPRLGTETGRAAPFVLAPRNEQTRIANQLHTLLSRIQTCKDRFEAIPALLKQFRQVVLNAASTGALTEEWRGIGDVAKANWKTVALKDVISSMKNGLAQKPTESPPGSKILRIGAVRTGYLNLKDHRYLFVSDKEVEQYALKKDDLLFTRYNGSLEFVGVCAVLAQDAPGYVYPDKLIRVRIREGSAVAKFIEITFGSRNMRRQVEGFVKSSAGQRGVSGADLKAARFFLPPVAEQTEIVRRVEAFFAIADRIEAHCIKASAYAQRLTSLVISKAFRGELVPQDPNDEPASTLLARITMQPTHGLNQAKTRAARKPRAKGALKETTRMAKSRQDDDVNGKPYLSDHLRRIGAPISAEALFKVAELPIADFYKQLAWELDQGFVQDRQEVLEPRDAA